MTQTTFQKNKTAVRKILRLLSLFVIVIGTLTLAAAIAGATGLCDSLFYYPTSALYSSPAEEGIAFEQVQFQSADGTMLSGWFMPAKAKARGTIIHCHGNAENMTSHWEFVKFLTNDFNVFVFDYRGYGASEGSPSRAGTIADAKAAVEYVIGRRDVDKEKIALFGQSLGGAVATVVAAQDNHIKALALDSAFSSYREEAAFVLKNNAITNHIARPLAWLLITSGYDPAGHIAKIAPRPLFIMHGTADAIVPVIMSRKLFDRAGEPKELWLIEDAPHTAALFLHPLIAQPKLVAFFTQAFGEN